MASKYSDLFLNKDDLVNGDNQARLLNFGHAGFEGVMPIIGDVIDGTTYEAHLSSSLYVGQSVIAKVISTPGFMAFMPNPRLWQRMWVALVEEHPRTITGFNSSLNADTDTFEVGGTGEQQEVPKGTKRTRTNLTFEIPDRMHKAASKFLGLCLTYGVSDYVTHKPLASNYINSLDDIGGGWAPHMWSGTVAFIEPDPTRLEVVDAWLGVQFWFKNTGDRTAKKNMANGGDTTSLNIETSGIYLGTGKVFEFCRQLLPNISNIRAIPDVDMELPNDVIEPEVEAVQR